MLTLAFVCTIFDLQKQGFHVKRNYSNGHSADSVTLMTYRSLEEFICSGIGLHILFLHLLTLKCKNLYICLMVSQRLQRDQCLTTSCRGRAPSYQLYALRWNWWGVLGALFWGRDMINRSNQIKKFIVFSFLQCQIKANQTLKIDVKSCSILPPSLSTSLASYWSDSLAGTSAFTNYCQQFYDSVNEINASLKVLN